MEEKTSWGGTRPGAGRPKKVVCNYTLNEYEKDFLRMALQYEGKEPSDENLKVKVKGIFKNALTQELKKVFLRYQEEHKDVSME